MTKKYQQKLTENQKKIMDERVAFNPDFFSKDDILELLDIYAISTSKDDISDFTKIVWFCNFPISIDLSRDIVDSSKYMDKRNVKNLYFTETVLDVNVEEFLNILVGIGNSLGVDSVSKKIYNLALQGDEKFCRMYLDMFKGKITSEVDVDSSIMRVSVKLDKEVDKRISDEFK